MVTAVMEPEILIDFSKAEVSLDPLTPEQEKIVSRFTEGSLLVDAGPAAGKTRLTVNFAKNLILNGVDQDDILMLSFTRVAVKVLKERLALTERSTLHSHGFRHSSEARRKFLQKEDFNELLVGGNRKYKWVICDEAQDLTRAQFKALAQKGENFLLVGDPWQAIYTWAGAMPELMDIFCEQFCNGRRASLTVNHRSKEGIVQIGNKFSDRSMTSVRPGGMITADEPRDYKNLTILFRTNKEVENFSHFLRVRGFPHTNIITDSNGKTATNISLDGSKEVTNPKDYFSTLICTMHASKGEEWDRVWVRYKPLTSRDIDWEAEERLFYVAITRAKNELYIEDLSYRFIRRLL